MNDSATFQMGLSKQTETGATLGVVNNINWSYQNSSFLVWPSAYTTNVQLTLTQPLLGSAPLPGQPAGQPVGLEANRAPIVIARLNADAAVWRFKAEVMAHCRSVEQQYWNLAQSHVQLWSSDRAVSLAQEILNREQAELQVGRGTVADVAEAAQRLEQFNLDLVTRTSDVITTERQLRNILGLPPADNRRIIPVTPPTEARLEPDWDASLAQMLNFQPDIVQQQILVRVAELQLLIARNQLLPQLNFNALYQLNGLGQSLDSSFAVMTGAALKALNPVIAKQQTHAGLQSQPGTYNNFVTWQTGFTFQAPLGMRSPLANTRQAQYILLRARAYLQQVVHQTTHSLARFFLEIDANYKQFKTASRLRAAAAQRLDAQRAYYEEGRITIDRFLDAVSQYATAVATEAQYKTTYNVSICALEEAKGTLLAYDNIAVAEGPHPRKAYVQARDIQDAHKQFHILPDGPQVPKTQVGPLNPDPIDEKAPPGTSGSGPQPYQPGPSGPLGPRPNTLPPYTPAGLLPALSQAGPGSGSGSRSATSRDRWPNSPLDRRESNRRRNPARTDEPNRELDRLDGTRYGIDVSRDVSRSNGARGTARRCRKLEFARATANSRRRQPSISGPDHTTAPLTGRWQTAGTGRHCSSAGPHRPSPRIAGLMGQLRDIAKHGRDGLSRGPGFPTKLGPFSIVPAPRNSRLLDRLNGCNPVR